MGRKKQKNINNVQVDKSRVKFKAEQSANASVNQGGNAFAINANELGVIRVRTGG
ncbi:hypothetical protein GCM10023310_51440 [Paenibacillus vulneris]|uniref:Spore protein n=1 Tax=Paenibacillus vulneris TaxID=1133364 RepID=A0ABW3UN70_9BACL